MALRRVAFCHGLTGSPNATTGVLLDTAATSTRQHSNLQGTTARASLVIRCMWSTRSWPWFSLTCHRMRDCVGPADTRQQPALASATLWASQNPDKVDSLVLLCPAATLRTWRDDTAGERQAVVANPKAAMSAAFTNEALAHSLFTTPRAGLSWSKV